MKRYRLSAQATRDFDEIADFIAARDPDAADRLSREIERRCEALAERPEMGRSREEPEPGLRGSVVRKYLIFYRIADEGIDVVRIVHGARDLPKLFE